MDVLIPSIERDRETLSACIRSIRRHCPEAERIFVISEKRLTYEAEWIPEYLYPFSKEDITRCLSGIRVQYADRAGWFLQQCLKLYAMRVMPELGDRILMVDSDVIWLENVSFTDEEDGKILLNIGVDSDNRYNHSVNHILGIQDRYPYCNGVAHHMVFDRAILENMLHDIENRFEKPLWKIALDFNISFSEWNLYFKYALNRFPDQVRLRPLAFQCAGHLKEVNRSVASYAALQAHRRNGKKTRWQKIRAYQWPPALFPANLRCVDGKEAIKIHWVHRGRFLLRHFLEWVRHHKTRFFTPSAVYTPVVRKQQI